MMCSQSVSNARVIYKTKVGPP
ncbi:hypothetical protein NPIL_662481, partial [Nephila pilipes]